MNERIQLLRQNAIGDKWEFVAHGAVYGRKEADAMRQLIERNGHRVKELKL